MPGTGARLSQMTSSVVPPSTNLSPQACFVQKDPVPRLQPQLQMFEKESLFAPHS